MSAEQDKFHWADYVIFALMLLVSCGIGVYHGFSRKKPNQAEYLLGGRQMKWLPVALSLLVSFTSGVSQLGKPVEMYQYGIQFLFGVIGTVLSMLIVVYTFLPLLFKLQLTSSYEYLELRFESKAVRCIGSITVIIFQLIYIGLATYSPAIALEAVTGLPIWASMLCVGIVATFYTMLGGMKAVVWSDVFQAIIMIIGTLVIIVVGLIKVGGWQNMWNINLDNDRITFFNFDPSPRVRLTFWGLTIGRMFGWLPFFAVNQASVQRYCCVPTLKKAKMMLLMNIPAHLFVDVGLFLIGMIIYSYFSQCDPITHPDPEQRLSSPNQLLPIFVMKVMGWPGVPGVFLASIFSGSLSTVSSSLNALATITWEDFLKWKFDYLSERTKTNLLKALVLVFGVVGVVFAFMASLLRGHILQVSTSFLDTSSSSLMGLYILGAFFTRSNWVGAIVGSCLGLALPMWISVGSFLAVPATPTLTTSVAGCAWNGTSVWNATTAAPFMLEPVEGINKIYTVSFVWFPMIGTLTTVLIGYIVSVITAPFIKAIKPGDVSNAYLIYPLDRCCAKSENVVVGKDALDPSELKEFTTKERSPALWPIYT